MNIVILYVHYGGCLHFQKKDSHLESMLLYFGELSGKEKKKRKIIFTIYDFFLIHEKKKNNKKKKK